MKTLSRWASHHVRMAVVLLVLCEVLNALNGILLGANLLEGWPAGSLLLLMIGLLAGVVFIHTRPVEVLYKTYWTSRKWLFGAFMSTYLLFVVLGGLWAGQVQTSITYPTAWGIRQVAAPIDTLVQPGKRQSVNQDYYTEAPQKATDQTGKRLGFILLFLAGLVIAGYAVGLACNLTCAGNGTAAFLVGLLGTGILAGGFFFLSRAFGKVIKPWKEMIRPERKRVYLRALLLLLGFFGLMILSSLANS